MAFTVLSESVPEIEGLVIFTVKVLVTVALFLSVTVSVNLNVPDFVGVPESFALLPEYVNDNSINENATTDDESVLTPEKRAAAEKRAATVMDKKKDKQHKNND